MATFSTHSSALFSAATSPANRCEAIANPNIANVFASVFILAGLLGSYLPQHWRIYSRRTTEGISPYFVLLGTTSATAGFANIITTEPSRQDIACCKIVDGFDCAVGLLGIAQLGVQFLCYVAILLLYLIFFREASPDEATDADAEAEIDPKTSRYIAIIVGSVCVLHAVFIAAITAVLAFGSPTSLNTWANFLGVMAAMLAAVQYLPQIWTTWHLKHVGSLSIPMMCIQTPGGIVFAISLYGRLGMRGWSTWGIYVLSATMQGTLLVMAIYFEIARENAAATAARRAAARASRRAARSHQPSVVVPQRPGGPFRTYSEAYDDALPGPYTAHPQSYAETPDELDRLLYREERQINNETRPLLAPGGIGTPHRHYSGGPVDPAAAKPSRSGSKNGCSRRGSKRSVKTPITTSVDEAGNSGSSSKKGGGDGSSNKRGNASSSPK
ncbi:ATP synthase F0 [Ceratocystis lukuohia]|uniref:ATP synthase F0 n=1 Tax=Ceratocystis lukuohia TaxID=2019550 RepID=A0ABR4MKN3_9PEZI